MSEPVPFLGDLERIGPLGQGAMSQVELARDRRTGRFVARKVAGPRPEDKAALSAEYQLLTRLRHPQIPSVIAFYADMEGVGPTLLLRVVEGVGLEEALTTSSADTFSRYLAQALNVLGFVHDRGVIHADVKPANMRVSTTGLLHLLDFGLAGASPTGGTRRFMSPARLEGQQGSVSADLYALGQSFLGALPPIVDPVTRAVLDRLAHPDADLQFRTAWEGLEVLREGLPEGIGELPLPEEPLWVEREEALAAVDDALSARTAGLRPSTGGILLVTGESGSGRTRTLGEARDRAMLRSLRTFQARADQPASRYPKEVDVVLLDDADDARWAESFERHLARGDGPLLIATTKIGSVVHNRMAPWRRGNAVAEVSLRPLSDAAVIALIASMWPSGRRVPQGLGGLSQGNAALATVLARSFAWRFEVSDLGRDLVRSLIATLDPALQTLAELLAMIRQPISASALSDLAECSGDEMTARIEGLCARGFVVDDLGGPRLTEVVRDVVIETLEHERAVLLAERILRDESCVTLLGSDALARLCAVSGRWDAAHAFGTSALEQHRKKSAFDEIVGLTSLLMKGSSGAALTDLKATRAEALMRLGRIEACRETLRALEPMSRAQRVRRLVLESDLFDASGSAQQALARLEDAVGVALEGGLGTDETARLSERLGASYFRLGRLLDARSTWESAVTGLTHEGSVAADLWNDLGALASREGRADDARLHLERALRLRRQTEDLEGEARALSNLGGVALRARDVERAGDLYRSSLALAEELGLLPVRAIVLGNLAVVAEVTGDYSEAIALTRRSLTDRLRLGDMRGEGNMRRQLARLYLAKSDLLAAREELSLARALLDSAFPVQVAFQESFEAQLALQFGQFDVAASKIDDALARAAGPAKAYVSLIRARWAVATADRRAASYIEDGFAQHLGSFEAEHFALLGMRWAWNQGALDAALEWDRRLDALPGRREVAVYVEQLLLRSAYQRRAESLLPSGESEIGDALRWLASAEEAGKSLTVPDLEHRIAWFKGYHALESGQHRRAVRWWRRLVEDLLEVASRLSEPKLVSGYLSLRERRSWIAALERLTASLRDGELTS